MDLVLGLSMTSSSVRWVLVEGATGEGATLDRGSLPTGTGAAFDANALLSALLDKAGARRVHAIGLTWTSAAEATASAVWQDLTDRRIENIIAVSDLEAAEALTCGIADIAGYDRVVVCVVEPGAAVIAAVTPDGVIADRVDAAALGDVDGLSPDAVFVVGSGDVDAVVAELHQRTQAPVVSADEADLALARGAALASASAVSILDAQAVPAGRHWSPTVTLSAVLAAAVLTFVVSLSVALGMTLAPDDDPAQMARSETAARETTAPSPAKAAPRPRCAGARGGRDDRGHGPGARGGADGRAARRSAPGVPGAACLHSARACLCPAGAAAQLPAARTGSGLCAPGAAAARRGARCGAAVSGTPPA